ncbi:MAG: fused MFS/spermidine synthase, partial [Planctomycetota bacterium]|nr:fused MFS/spermidine synthase [Planctomycetota bacterium]
MSRAALAAFVAGAAVMALEILASRWMAPGLGFTLSTWAWLISVTLLAGAGGAALGGRLARAPRWSRAASLLIAAGAWAAALAFGAPAFVDALDAVDPELGAALAALLLVGPPVLVLGGVLPLATALAKETQPVGPTVGRLIAVSTLGSLAGTLLAAFLFVPHLGLEAGALVLAGVLMGVGLLLCAQRGAGLAALVIGCAASALTPSTPSGAAIERQTPYGLLTLSRAPHAGWTLAIDGIAQASVSPSAAGPGALLAHRQYT